MALAEIAAKDKKEDESIDALERLVNLYPENYLCEEAYFLLAKFMKRGYPVRLMIKGLRSKLSIFTKITSYCIPNHHAEQARAGR